MSDVLGVGGDRVRFVPETSTLDEARRALAGPGPELAVVGSEADPLTLVSPATLAAVREGSGEMLLSDLLDQLPPAVLTTHADAPVAGQLVTLAALVSTTGAPGVIVLTEGRVSGAWSRRAVGEALPLDSLMDGLERAGYGLVGVPFGAWVCRKCPPPLRRYVPRPGEVPCCPRDFSHGELEPDAGTDPC